MPSLFLDPDFQKNVYAGLLVLGLDFALIVVALPWVLRWDRRRRWAKTYKQMWFLAQREVVGIVGSLATVPTEPYLAGSLHNTLITNRDKLLRLMQVYGPALSEPYMVDKWNDLIMAYDELLSEAVMLESQLLYGFDVNRPLSAAYSKLYGIGHRYQTSEKIPEGFKQLLEMFDNQVSKIVAAMLETEPIKSRRAK